jgi:hypothetical protein
MRISDIRLNRTDEADELSAQLGAFEFRLVFPLGAVANPSGDAFLAAALLAAMALGEDIELDAAYTASPVLLAGLDRLQEIFAGWVPGLRRVTISARPAPPPPAHPGSATLFSGGADSLYTFLERHNDIVQAIHIRGFDYRREKRALADEIDRRNRAFIDGRGRTLTIVESNLRDLYDALRVHIYVYHGCHLASVALAIGRSRVYVPSSFPWATIPPWGSHPLTDPLWGNGAVELVHHGASAGRVDKLRRIGENADAMDLLRVCPGFDSYCCGVCEKCLRTRAALRLLRLQCPNLAPLDSVQPIHRLHIGSVNSRINWTENHRLARVTGDRALERAIGFALAGYAARDAVRIIDDVLTNGTLLRTRRRLRQLIRREPAPMDEIRIDAPR